MNFLAVDLILYILYLKGLRKASLHIKDINMYINIFSKQAKHTYTCFFVQESECYSNMLPI